MVARESCGEPWLLQPKIQDMEMLEYRWTYEGWKGVPGCGFAICNASKHIATIHVRTTVAAVPLPSLENTVLCMLPALAYCLAGY